MSLGRNLRDWLPEARSALHLQKEKGRRAGNKKDGRSKEGRKDHKHLLCA